MIPREKIVQMFKDLQVIDGSTGPRSEVGTSIGEISHLLAADYHNE
jgi:hypothetical protein